MKVSKGLATWAGVIAAAGQYLGAIAIYLTADDPTTAAEPLKTATVTLLVVVAGRMGQAIGLAVKTPKSAASRSVGVTVTGDAGQINRAATADEPGDPDALPDYATDENVPPDEGDTSANGDTGERES
jgi:hypothetical protein